jgi:hypothetical protein
LSIKLKLLTSTLALAMAGSMFTAARAEELWDPYLRGVFEGVPAGALPPPGVYGELDNYYAAYSDYGPTGNKIPGTHLNVLVEVPIVLWVPGIKVLGATYAAAIAQPFDYNSYEPLQNTHGGGGNLGIYNTILIPGMLSWSLPQHFFVRAGVSIYLNDATNTMADLVDGKLSNGGVPSGNGYSTIQPDLGFSWLDNGWNVSVGTHYAFPVGSTTTTNYNYRSAPEFSADYTVTKTIGAWTMGVGAEQEDQFSKDTFNGQPKSGSIARNYGVGPIVGYQLHNGVDVTAVWNHSFATASDVGGNFFDIRLTTAF